MAKFPVKVFTRQSALLGHDDEYRSSLIGQKFAGMPKGVYVGFIPSILSPVLTLSPDPTEGFSLLKAPSFGDPGGMDVIIDSAITFDFIGQPDGDFPIHIIARVTYTEGLPTTAQIITRSAQPVVYNEVLICILSGTAGALVLQANPSLGERDAPLAFTGTPFGFMPAGAIEDMEAAADAVNEVVAARIGLDLTVHPSLSDRLAADQTAASMAGRLALALRVFRSNDYDVPAGEEEMNVSGSFSEIDREHNPFITLGGLGSETAEGVVAAPNDAVRNVCIIVDADTGYRPVDDPSARRLIFGRIDGPDEIIVTGTWSFVNADTDVSAIGGQAQSELEVGYTLQGSDGKFYEIETISGNNNLTLKNAYTGPSASSANLIARRWKLRFRKIISGVEDDASFTIATKIRFFFSAFVRHNQSHGDWTTLLHSTGEKTPVINATTAALGLVRLATPGAALGAVNIQNIGVPLGPFHIVNFSAVEASIVPGPNAGELEVAEIGPQGPQGPTGPSGPAGPAGEQGPGFSQKNPFKATLEAGSASIAPPTPFTFTEDVGHNIRYLAGNIATRRDQGIFVPGADIIDITALEKVSDQEARIAGTFAGDNFTKFFFSTAGD